MSHEPAPSSPPTLDGPRVCDSDPEVPEAGLRGPEEAERTAPRLLLVAQSVHDRDAEDDPEAVQSDADDGRPSGNLSVSAGTPSDNIVLGSLPDGDEQGLSQRSGTTEKYTGRVSSGSSDAGSTQNSAAGDVEEVKQLPGSVIIPGFDNCVLELIAFRQGERPGLERLKDVLENIYKAYGITDLEVKRAALIACNLAPIGTDKLSFLIPEEHMSPSWTKRSRPRLNSPGGSQDSTTPVFPA